jgi:hypothetical protein
MVEGEVHVRWKGPWGICFTLWKKTHYYKMWVQFTGPCLVNQWTHCILTRFYSVRPVNSLKIQWSHLTYTHAFCCNDYLWFILLLFLPQQRKPFFHAEMLLHFSLWLPNMHFVVMTICGSFSCGFCLSKGNLFFMYKCFSTFHFGYPRKPFLKANFVFFYAFIPPPLPSHQAHREFPKERHLLAILSS